MTVDRDVMRVACGPRLDGCNVTWHRGAALFVPTRGPAGTQADEDAMALSAAVVRAVIAARG